MNAAPMLASAVMSDTQAFRIRKCTNTTGARSSTTKKVGSIQNFYVLANLAPDDTHIPTLTVAQTLEFALSTKTPGANGRLPGISRKDFDHEIRDLLLKMLNISHTSSTLVGDEFVRGVSGGERKRVSIAEMMATR
jgi:ABC-type multidrug transport system ATPase subunit